MLKRTYKALIQRRALKLALQGRKCLDRLFSAGTIKMASEFLDCPQGQWTQVNVGSRSGVIELIEGNVIFTEQTALPTSAALSVAPNGRLSLAGQERRYITSIGNYIFAYAVKQSKLSVTPDSGVR